MIQQNLGLCLLYSVLAGIAAVLEYPPLILYENAERRTQLRRNIATLTNLFFQFASSGFMTVAPMYGPVSVYRPVTLAAKLVSNMIVIGIIMKQESFNKATQIATFLITTSAFLVPVVGPAIQEEQDAKLLVMKPHALVWCSILTIIFLVSTAIMLFVDLKDLKYTRPRFVQVILLSVSLTASVLSGSLSRAFTSLTGFQLVLMWVFYIMLHGSWIIENMIEATAAPSLALFVPTFVGANILLNALTGLILWEEWRVVNSWVGYSFISVQMLLALYLMSNFDYFIIGPMRSLKKKANQPVMSEMSERTTIMNDRSEKTVIMNDGSEITIPMNDITERSLSYSSYAADFCTEATPAPPLDILLGDEDSLPRDDLNRSVHSLPW